MGNPAVLTFVLKTIDKFLPNKIDGYCMFEPDMQLTMVLVVAVDESHVEFVCVVAQVLTKVDVP